MAFDSAGAGFSRGFATGSQIRLQREQLRTQKDAKEQARIAESGRQLRESLAQAREQSLVGFRQAVELATKAAESGASEAQIATIRQMASASLASFAQTAQQLRAQAMQAGATPDIVSQLPDGAEFVAQNLPMFDAAVETGKLGTAEAVGARQGTQRATEAERIATALGVDVNRVAEAMNLVPADPDPERVGQRVVRGVGEAEVFRDKTTNQLFIQDAQGNRRVIGSADITTPTERMEQGGPGAFDPRTQAQQGEAVTLFQDAAIGGTSAIESAAQLLQIAKQSPESLGAPGAMLRIGNEFLRTASALGGMLGVDVGVERDVDAFSYEGFSGALREAAIENQAFRAGVFGVAFAAAVAEQGARPTDKDIQAFIDQIGGSTADPQGFARTVDQFVNRIDRRLRTTARVKNIPKEIQDAAFGELDRALGVFKQELPGKEPANGDGNASDLAAQAEAAIAAGDFDKAQQLIEQMERGNQR